MGISGFTLPSLNILPILVSSHFILGNCQAKLLCWPDGKKTSLTDSVKLIGKCDYLAKSSCLLNLEDFSKDRSVF